MIHLLFFLLFAAIIAIGFGVIASGHISDRLRYGCKIFAEFVGIGLLLAWLSYFLPF